MEITMKIYILSLFLIASLCADNFTLENKLSITTGTYVKHISPRNSEHSYEGFKNQYIDIRYQISPNSKIVIGTLKNSQANRCLLLGLEHKWYDLGKRISFKGLYAYSGEFFFDAFDSCSNGGSYKDVKDKIGIGFVPYIYHGFEFELSKNISLDAGFLLPLVAVVGLRFNF